MIEEQAIFDRTPPQSIEAEQALLGAIMLDSETIVNAASLVSREDFYSPTHREIYQAMVELNDSNEPIDLITLTALLKRKQVLEEVGGVPYLTKLVESVPTAANVEYYGKIVQEKALIRHLIRTATEIVSTGYRDEEEVAVLVNDAEQKILNLARDRGKSDFIQISNVLVDVFENVEKLFMRKASVTGIPSGFIDLDKMTSGFQRNDLIIVAARPSVGKTAFALNIAQNVGAQTGETVAIFSLEMGAAQLVQRMLCAESSVEANKIRNGHLDDRDWERLTMAVGSLSNAKIYIDDTSGITVSDIRAKCRRLKKQVGLGMIVIDYLQLIQGRGKGGENRQQEVSEISRTLKQIARELEVPVIALSQLSRGVEQRQDKRPMLSDLRESGSIEQDADIVAFLYREDYYNKEAENNNIIEIIIAKQRNGPVGTVKLLFKKEFNRFHSYAENKYE